MAKKTNSHGFSLVVVLVAVLVAVLLAGGGWYVWQKNNKDDSGKKSSTTGQSSDTKKTSKHNATAADPYKGWQSYGTSRYGFSFRYPSDWKVEEADGTVESPSSTQPITVRFAANVKRNEDVKYNNTVSIEVLNNDLASAADALDREFGQSSANKVTKTTDTLKGKTGVQYSVSSPDGTMKVYLFALGDRTYKVSSVNEPLNTQTDPEYWAKFEKLFESLEFNK